MQKLTIGAFEARRQLSKLIENTRYKEQKLIIEKNGEEMAALVPVKILREWEEERERFFDSLFSGRRS